MIVYRTSLFSFFLLCISCTLPGPWQDGRATSYNIIGTNGNCGYQTIPSQTFPYQNTAAVDTLWYNGSSVCGQCLEIQCIGNWTGNSKCCLGNNTIIVQITDQCSYVEETQWCSGDINNTQLSIQAFGKLASENCSVLKTQWRQVSCPFSSKILIVEGGGISDTYFAVLFKNVGGYGSLSNVQVKSSEYQWINMERQEYNYWLTYASSPDPGLIPPLSFKIWDTNNQSLEFDNVLSTIEAFKVTTTSLQFGVNNSVGILCANVVGGLLLLMLII